MNRYRIPAPLLIALVMVGALTIGLVLWATEADASPSKRACTYDGVTNGYFHSGEQIVLDPYTPNTFHTYVCERNEMRIYRGHANTYHEVLDLKAFASENDHARFRMAFCKESATRAYIVDLAYFYYAEMKTIRQVEKKRYVDWLNAYAERHGCDIY